MKGASDVSIPEAAADLEDVAAPASHEALHPQLGGRDEPEVARVPARPEVLGLEHLDGGFRMRKGDSVGVSTST